MQPVFWLTPQRNAQIFKNAKYTHPFTHSSLPNSSFLSLGQFGVEYLEKKKKSPTMLCYYLCEQLQSFNILLEKISLQRKSHLPSHIL